MRMPTEIVAMPDSDPEEVQFFDLLSNEHMDVIATQVVALGETIALKAQTVNPKAATMDYTTEATQIYTTLLREVLRGASEGESHD